MQKPDDLYTIHQLDQLVAALLSNGDMVKVGENDDGPLYEPTAKGVAKGVMERFAVVTAQADEEGRSYTQQEKRELLDALGVLQQALTRTKPFLQLQASRSVPFARSAWIRIGRRFFARPWTMLWLLSTATTMIIWRWRPRQEQTARSRSTRT